MQKQRPLSFNRLLLNPLAVFFADTRAIGITLVINTALSLWLSNGTAFAAAYTSFWQQPFTNGFITQLQLPHSPLALINDFLMAVFFLLAGMEIKREFVSGELSTKQQATLPIVGAIGGMIVPAILFALFNKGTHYMSGWAISSATDIAFTLGIASLLGNKVPVSIKIFITALAIIDDLGAIIIIALFYGGAIHALYLLGVVIACILLWLLQKRYKTVTVLHWAIGLALWYCMHRAGIHATVAGVVFAFLIPTNELTKWELRLHKPVYFFIVPLFALANTAIIIPEHFGVAVSTTLSLGIMAGLVIGKPLGISAACYALIKTGKAALPANTNWKIFISTNFLAGIGFTMSIFIATLAFSSSIIQDQAKIAVLCASLIATILGSLFLASNKP
jgi:NhaA family Na+:H+ antiporter